MNLGVFLKQPTDVLDYDIDYTDWLVDEDTVQSALATSAPNTLTVESVFTTTNRVKVWLSEGADNTTYKVTVVTTTADGRVREDEFRVRVKDL